VYLVLWLALTEIRNRESEMKAMLAFAIIGCVIMIFAGVFMVRLESQAGNTVAEAFYQYVGLALIGGGIFGAMMASMNYHRDSGGGY
jgi:hypothetical protein